MKKREEKRKKRETDEQEQEQKTEWQASWYLPRVLIKRRKLPASGFPFWALDRHVVV